MIRGAVATASDATAAAAAQATLVAGASAVDAIIAAFLAASGAEPGALLSPCVALVAGTGVGARAFDGRAAQPGRGAARPRGFLADASVPDAAFFAVPRSLAMIALLHSYLGRAKLRDLGRHGVVAAEKQGATRRADLLRKIAAAGVVALRAREVEGALLEQGGSVLGGALTADDLEEVRPIDVEARVSTVGEQATALSVPWEAEGEPLHTEGIVACDGRGIVAALAYTPARQGITIEALELVAGKHAIPVRRGVPRVQPGTLLGAPSPIALLTRGGNFWAAIALPGQVAIAPTLLGDIAGGLAVETALAEVRARTAGRMVIAAVRDGRDARAIVSA